MNGSPIRPAPVKSLARLRLRGAVGEGRDRGGRAFARVLELPQQGFGARVLDALEAFRCDGGAISAGRSVDDRREFGVVREPLRFYP